MKATPEILFSFGLVADVQYSDLDDAHTEGRTQRYREAPSKLRKAVDHWLARKAELSFVLNLGDIINGNTADPGKNSAELDEIANIFDRLVSQWDLLPSLPLVVCSGTCHHLALHVARMRHSSLQSSLTNCVSQEHKAPELPVYHTIGNHCLSVKREHLLERLKLRSCFYSVPLPHQWRLVVLDTTEMSGHSNLPEILP